MTQFAANRILNTKNVWLWLGASEQQYESLSADATAFSDQFCSAPETKTLVHAPARAALDQDIRVIQTQLGQSLAIDDATSATLMVMALANIDLSVRATAPKPVSNVFTEDDSQFRARLASDTARTLSTMMQFGEPPSASASMMMKTCIASAVASLNDHTGDCPINPLADDGDVSPGDNSGSGGSSSTGGSDGVSTSGGSESPSGIGGSTNPPTPQQDMPSDLAQDWVDPTPDNPRANVPMPIVTQNPDGTWKIIITFIYQNGTSQTLTLIVTDPGPDGKILSATGIQENPDGTVTGFDYDAIDDEVLATFENETSHDALDYEKASFGLGVGGLAVGVAGMLGCGPICGWAGLTMMGGGLTLKGLKLFGGGTKLCQDFRVAPGLSVSYNMSTPTTYGDALQNWDAAPNVATAIQNCVCQSGTEAGQGADFLATICPTEADKARADCLANPYGPDDALSPQCLAILTGDLDDAAANLNSQGICKAALCSSEFVPVSLVSENVLQACGCLPQETLTQAIDRGCSALDCGSESYCQCVDGSCGCVAGTGSSIIVLPTNPAPGTTLHVSAPGTASSALVFDVEATAMTGFGFIPVGSSETRLYRLTNIGAAETSPIDVLILNYLGSPAFTINGGDCKDGVTVLPTGGSCTIGVRFAPTSGGNGRATLSVRAANVSDAASLDLVGIGVLPGTIKEYPVSGRPTWIAAGADGNLWFDEVAANQIGRITTTGAVSEFPVPTQKSLLSGITAGSDGNIWFSEQKGNKIGRISSLGVITEFAAGTAPSSIVAGPDGNLWFTELAGKIGRLTTAGVLSEFALPIVAPGTSYLLDDIGVGPDGNIWFTGEASIRSIAIDGTLLRTLESPNRYGQGEHGITSGPDGNLWLTDGIVGPSWELTRMTVRGAFTTFGNSSTFLDPRLIGGHSVGITVGPDKSIWTTFYSESVTLPDEIVRTTLSGTVTAFSLPSLGSGPYGIVAGNDGNLWFTELEGNKVGVIVP